MQPYAVCFTCIYNTICKFRHQVLSPEDEPSLSLYICKTILIVHPTGIIVNRINEGDCNLFIIRPL
jgi:hypothetical protein